jgi:hypothetical protein
MKLKFEFNKSFFVFNEIKPDLKSNKVNFKGILLSVSSLDFGEKI